MTRPIVTTRMLTGRIGYVRCLCRYQTMHVLYLGVLGGLIAARYDYGTPHVYVRHLRLRIGRWYFWRIPPTRRHWMLVR